MRVNGIAPRRRARVVRASRALSLGAAAALAHGGCASRARAVPRPGTVEIRDYLGDPSRAAAANETLSADPRQLWRTAAGRGSLGPVALGDAVAVVASVDRWVTALDLRTGRPYWRKRAEAPMGVGALVGGGKVYVAELGGGGRVVAMRLRDGKRLWRRAVGAVSSPMVLDGGTIYGVSRDGRAFALRADDGRPRWQRVVGGGSRTGPLVLRGLVALVTVADTLVVLDAASGRVEARRALPGGVAAPLARMDDSTLAVASPGGWMAAVALPSGEVRWRVDTGAPVAGSPAVTRDTLFALTERCTLWAVPVGAPAARDTLALAPLAADDGAPCTTVAAPGLVRGGVVVATVAGTLLYFDRATRRLLWSRRLPGELRHPPGIRNGQLVAAPLLGDVVSFR